MLNPVAAAIPVFFLLIGIEAWIGRSRGWYRWNDTHGDLGAGVLDQVLEALFGAVMLVPYTWVWQRRVVDLPDSLVTLAGAVVAVDFAYYWWHRASHRVAWMWAIHAVHHQSTEYNLAVALRQSAFAKFSSWMFYLPLALFGVSPAIYLGARAIDLLYQFWIHTRGIRRLGPLEGVMNTPSHHRVHHATNRRYLDTNYGGILIVFDRWFGTFVAEDEEPDYGTLVPLTTWNPVAANLRPWADLWRRAAALPTWSERLLLWWRPPEWLPGGRSYPFPTDAELKARRRYDADAPRWRAWMVSQWAGVAAGVVWLLVVANTAPLVDKVAVAIAVAWTLGSFGALLDGRPGARMGEVVRIVGVMGLLGFVAFR